VFQIHASEYRNAAALPTGAVLVVGSGASGCQIAEELLEAGRRVYLCVGRHRRAPRRYRGRDVFWWRRELGHLDLTAEATPKDRRTPGLLLTGTNGGHAVNLRQFAARGMTLLGHLRAIHESRIALDSDLEDNLRAGDQACDEFKGDVDDYVTRMGIDAPRLPGDAVQPRESQESIGEIDVRASAISSVIWATGYALDFGWVELPIFDELGEPVHRRGITPVPGVYVLGLAWLHKRKSSFLYGVGEDAEYLAERIHSA
jgi:putative flavoprotein involved in K+ transport